MSEQRSKQTPEAALRICQVPVASLRPFPGNPRIMSSQELEKLKRSISEFGFVELVAARKADNTIVGGHWREEAAKALHLKTVPVVYVDVSEAEARALCVALSKIGGEWDLPQLGHLLEELKGLPDLGETLSGFDEKEMESLLADLERQQMSGPYEESFDLAAEALQQHRESAPTRVKPGDTWQLGRHRLYCGDSLVLGALEQLLDGGKVDLVLTDPPYGIGYQSTLAKRGRRKRAIANDAAEDYNEFLSRALPMIKSTMKRGAVMYWFAGGGGGDPVLAKALLAITQHFDLLNVLVWDKLDPGLGWRWRRSWEAIIEASAGKPRIWHGGTDCRSVLRFPKAIPQQDDHPTPKPVPLLEEIIRAAAPTRGIVLDPFAGAGPTLIAAERTGRSCLAAEIEPRYADIMLARWEALTGSAAAPARTRTTAGR